MLSGISEKGTDHKDHMSFASELKLGTNSPTIELPNDADPSQGPVKYAPPSPCLIAGMVWGMCPGWSIS